MATFYVKTTGNDSSAGTSPFTSWRTIGKALGSSGVSSSDILYIAPGVYREQITINMTSATAETQIIGDITGFFTNSDPGEVQWTGYVINDQTISSSTTLLNLNARDFLTFRNICFVSGNATIITATSTTSTDIKFLNCSFLAGHQGSNAQILLTIGFGISANWVIGECIFRGGNSTSISVTLTTGTGQDYDSNIIIKNCLFFLSAGTAISIGSSGTSLSEGGGVKITNCSFFSSGAACVVNSTRVGGVFFSFPIFIYNCLFHAPGAISLSASEIGSIVENYNAFITSSPRSNVAIGPNSISDGSISPLFHFGQERIFNQIPKPWGYPMRNSPLLGRGDATLAPTGDALGNIRPKGQNNLLFAGTITNTGRFTITDTTKSFGDSSLMGYMLKILDGPAAGESKTINGNTNTLISGDGLFTQSIPIGSKYAVYNSISSLTSVVSSGLTSTVITDNYAKFGTNNFRGMTLTVTSGAAKGQNFIISGNSPTAISGFYPLYVSPTSGDTYSVYQGAILTSTVTSATSQTLTDLYAVWPTNFWGGPSGGNSSFGGSWRCMITSGTASGANFVISGNSPTDLTGWAPFGITPISGDTYKVFTNSGTNMSGYVPSGQVPAYGTEFIHCAVGAYEPVNNAIKETGTVLSGSNSIRIFGPGQHDFDIPVSGTSTTISVFANYNDVYKGNKPQLSIVNAQEVGLSDSTVSMVGVSGQWEKMSITIIPSGLGVVTARIISNATGSCGSVFFDAFGVS